MNMRVSTLYLVTVKNHQVTTPQPGDLKTVEPVIDHGPLKLSNILRLREKMEIVTLKYCSSTAPYMDMCKHSKQINRKKT